ncbi:expressed hypothetical protein [Trichoplax adhaerens]|uniref:Sodium/calcium exchanger membrane region domain-containing protein n=1 Tax=Trichoplax adhaerens TaxID=10228 RepID=B3RSG1_TRIAD|nr:expressed hypothetical protein [Trichoplax adhaerens]EDV26509.1 expressed hypothetical protein [Trichoplax adhaerens]|eukprot:XP_002110505.1 expressed hypothetical protein [Trichoplax adhaerens]
MFVALSIVCDNYFVPTLEVIVVKWSISEDVAGATFMAAGGSAPELFTSLIGTFIARSNVGFGTIIGSAVFNILFVIGMCAILSKQVLQVTWWPLFRDCIFYLLALCALVIAFTDSEVYWYESLLLILFYIIYCTFMKYNAVIEVTVKKQLIRWRIITATPVSHDQLPTGNQAEESSKATLTSNFTIEDRSVTGSSDNARNSTIEECENGKKVDIELEEEYENEGFSLSWPKSFKRRAIYIIVLPISFLLYYTLPNVARPRGKRYYLVGFIGSIVWIAVYSYFMVWWSNEIGITIGIPPEIMGLTILAAGTSIPDLITSVIVARKGFGDMAVSSSVGSNLFDVTLGLPFPWLLYSIIFGFPVSVESRGLACSVILLLSMVVFVIMTIALFRWRLNKSLGFLFLILYVGFVVISILMQNGAIPCL